VFGAEATFAGSPIGDDAGVVLRSGGGGVPPTFTVGSSGVSVVGAPGCD
jgi:hypothetical protein